jgi:hypothetical protein
VKWLAPWRDDLPAEPDGWRPLTRRERILCGLVAVAIFSAIGYQIATASSKSEPIGYLVIGFVVFGTGVVWRRRR